MKFYLPEIVFKNYKIELDKEMTVEDIDKLFFIEEETYFNMSAEEKDVLNISSLILHKAINDSVRENKNIEFTKKFVALEGINHEDIILPLFGNEYNPYLITTHYDNLSEIDYMTLSHLRTFMKFDLIDMKIFTDILNKGIN